MVDEEGNFVYDREDAEVSFVNNQQEKEGETPANTLLNQGTEEAFPPLQKKWGPTYGTRQSTRNQGKNKTIMEIAQEAQKIRNLEKPANPKAKGNKNPPSFAMFNDTQFNHVARIVGVVVNSDLDSVQKYLPSCSNVDNSLKTGRATPHQSYLSVLQAGDNTNGTSTSILAKKVEVACSGSPVCNFA